VCLHATDPGTVHLSAWARVNGFAVAEMDRALYTDRTLIKHIAMRRTLFVFPRETLPFAQAAASSGVATTERKRLVRDVEAAGLHQDGEAWLAQASERVMAALAHGREATMTELRMEMPSLEGSISYGAGKSWAGNAPLGPRVLTVLSGEGRIVRAANDGNWTTSRPRWASMTSWLGEELALPCEADGVAHVVERWLRSFGPGTERDIKWWLGSTLTAVRRALTALGAVSVDLDGRTAYLMPDDSRRPTRWTIGPRCCRPSTPRRWAGPTAAGTWATTSTSSSTRLATRDPPPGGTAGSSAAGVRRHPVKCSCNSSKM
jgi:hypothetical protein